VTDVVNLGIVDYREALELQRSLAADVASGERPDTVLFLEHPPTITLGRRT
jgi:lipoyl(octanoyl) transferase